MLAMVIYWAINILVVNNGMDTVRRFENWAGPMVFVVMAVLLIYSINAAHGIGPVFHTPSKFHSTGELLLKGFFPMVAIYISGSWATMIGLPLATVVFYCMASIIVSSCIVLFGKAIWNPSDILVAINNPYLSIFGATLLAIATISVNIPANIVSPAYDLTNLMPKVFNFKSGAITSMVLAFLYMPWKLMENPAVLYGILNNIGALLGPATGIIIADFFLVRKQKLDVPELFKVNGRYRYTHGFSIVALGILLISAAIVITGEFVPAVAWLYNYAWFIGLFLGFVGYLVTVRIVSSGKDGVPETYQPIGSFGIELAEVTSGANNKA
jgi:NCS1 family nucleobase:cation symporter-1